MSNIILAFPGNETIAASISEATTIPIGKLEFRRFPDGESYVSCTEKLEDKTVYLICSLYQPDSLFIPLYFISKMAKDRGARKVILIAPYLSYMRQDKIFKEGEIISSKFFAELISEHFDALVTIDPHLHRIASLSEIYKIPSLNISSTGAIAKWVKNNVKNPVLIGPDIESRQWVENIAKIIQSPYAIMQKTRLGDRNVLFESPDLKHYVNHYPVIVDDIASSGRTLAKASEKLKEQGLRKAICIIVHPIFADHSIETLKKAHVSEVLSCNSIQHDSNRIDLSELIADCILNQKLA